MALAVRIAHFYHKRLLNLRNGILRVEIFEGIAVTDVADQWREACAKIDDIESRYLDSEGREADRMLALGREADSQIERIAAEVASTEISSAVQAENALEVIKDISEKGTLTPLRGRIVARIASRLLCWMSLRVWLLFFFSHFGFL